MGIKSTSRSTILVFIFVSFLSLCACTPQHENVSAPTPAGAYSVDPLFREYYQDLGGEERLGPAISPLIQQNSAPCQYTLNALMCHNPLATGVNRFYLAPLGQLLGIKDAPSPSLEQETPLVIDGYAVHPDFVDLYHSLHGSLVIGRPISNVFYNNAHGRVEQYFENIGFYHNLDDPSGKASLLAYGAFFCSLDCGYNSNPPARFAPQREDPNTPFLQSLDRIGGLEVFGRPLTSPFVAEDGFLEQVYENASVFAPLEAPGEIRLRPLPVLLGMIALPPGPRIYDQRQNVIFYPLQDELGYHVPLVFDRFIAAHGGLEISGVPIAETMRYEEENVIRQCFRNYCLDYYPQEAETFRVRLAPLGRRYLERIDSAPLLGKEFSKALLIIELSEEHLQITSKEPQTIRLRVLEKSDQQPLANVEARLTVTLPDGRQQIFYSPPTDAEGKASVVIPAAPELENGSLVVYEACLNVPAETPICAASTYLIWNFR